MAFIDPLTALNQFVIAFPLWKLVREDTDELYLLTANPCTQQNMFDFNPEDPDGVFRPGPYMHFFLSNLGSATFNGQILSFRTRGYTYKCDGLNLTISILPQ